MKKRIVMTILVCGVLAAMPAYAATMNGVDANSETKFEFANGTIEFVGYDIIKDYNDNDVIALQYDFTNTSTESHDSLDIFGTQVFQDSGIEVDTTITYDEEWGKLNNNLSRTVKPGVTISTAFIYELESTTSPVEVIVKDWDNYNDDHTIMIDISKYNEAEPVAETVIEATTEVATEPVTEKKEETVSTEVAAPAVSDSDYSVLQEEKEALESENAELQEKIKELESENASLKDQLEKAETATEAETETETETETEVSTEIVGLEYSDVAVVRIVQQALNSAGFDCGTPDGVAGSKTTEAIRAYQTNNNINVNGVITDELLESLGVADQITEAAKIEAQKAEYSADYSYEQLARNPTTYIGDKVKFSGKVLQVGSAGSDTNYIRLAANSNYDTVLFLTYDKSIVDYNVLDDDKITVYGSSFGEYSYETVMGATVTIPWINVDILELN